ECDLVSGEAGRRTVQLQAIALHNHPDGAESLLVSVRDTSPLRRLEASLQDDQQLQQLQARLAETESRLASAIAEQGQLVAQLDASRAEQQRLNAATQTRDAERVRTDEMRLRIETAAQSERAANEKLSETAVRLERLLAEHQRQTTLLEQS